MVITNQALNFFFVLFFGWVRGCYDGICQDLVIRFINTYLYKINK